MNNSVRGFGTVGGISQQPPGLDQGAGGAQYKRILVSGPTTEIAKDTRTVSVTGVVAYTSKTRFTFPDGCGGTVYFAYSWQVSGGGASPGGKYRLTLNSVAVPGSENIPSRSDYSVYNGATIIGLNIPINGSQVLNFQLSGTAAGVTVAARNIGIYEDPSTTISLTLL